MNKFERAVVAQVFSDYNSWQVFADTIDPPSRRVRITPNYLVRLRAKGNTYESATDYPLSKEQKKIPPQLGDIVLIRIIELPKNKLEASLWGFEREVVSDNKDQSKQ